MNELESCLEQLTLQKCQPKLRPYQVALLDDLKMRLKSPQASPLMYLPTGGGKTRVCMLIWEVKVLINVADCYGIDKIRCLQIGRT